MANADTRRTRFRPTNESAFSRAAKSLASILDLPLQVSQNLLARIYGYADLHELQQELKQQAEPGPFEDLSELIPVVDDCAIGNWLPPIVNEISSREIAKRDVRTLQLVRAATTDSDLDEWRRLAVCGAGLFCSPAVQRKRATQVLEAIRAIEEGAYPDEAMRECTLRGRAAIADLELFNIEKVSGLSKLAQSFGRRWSDGDPLKSFWTTRQRYACKAYLAARPEGIDADARHPWMDHLSQAANEFEGPELVELLTDEDWVSEVANIDVEKAFEAVNSADEVATDAWCSTLYEFCESPSEKAAGQHPLLSRIPDPVGLVRNWRELRFAALPEERQEEMDFHLASSNIAGTKVTVAVTYVESAESVEDLGIKLYEFQAFFLRPTKRADELQAIGVMSGVLVECYDEDHGLASADTIFWGMDAHSAMLNDVWKALNFTHAPERGFASLSEMLEAHLDEGGWALSAAIAVVSTLEIIPSLRGKGQLGDLLTLFLSASDRWSVGASMSNGDELADTADEFSDEGGVRSNPLALVFPVAGTKPEGTLTASLHLVASPGTVRVARRDPAVEQKREKLTRHFKNLESKLGVDVVVYNPWDYPTT